MWTVVLEALHSQIISDVLIQMYALYFLKRTFSELLEVSSLVSRETVLIQQSLEEDQIGQGTAQTLFCPSMS